MSPQMLQNILSDVSRKLNTIGAKYAIVVGGEEISNGLTVAKEKVVKRRRGPQVDMTEIHGLIDNSKPGQVYRVKATNLPLESLRSRVTARLSTKFGAGSYTSCMHPATKAVEFLRY